MVKWYYKLSINDKSTYIYAITKCKIEIIYDENFDISYYKFEDKDKNYLWLLALNSFLE